MSIVLGEDNISSIFVDWRCTITNKELNQIAEKTSLKKISNSGNGYHINSKRNNGTVFTFHIALNKRSYKEILINTEKRSNRF